MNRRKSLWLILLTSLGIGVLVWAFMPRPAVVETAPVTRGPFVLTVDEDGITRVRDRYIVTAPLSGTLLRPEVEEGDVVERNAPVATIVPRAPEMLDPRTRLELTARREAADARLARTRAVARQAEAESKQAELDVRRRQDLAKQGYISATELEQAQLTLDVRRKSLDAAIFEADAAMHELQQARAAVGRFDEVSRGETKAAAVWTIRSPIAGSILRVSDESGGPITAGGPILEVGDIGRLEAVIDVLSSDATRIKPGATVTLRAGENVTLTGHVRTIEPAAQTRVSALGVEEQRVNVIVELIPDPKGAGPVGDGYRVDAQIEVARIENAVRVPVAALFREGQNWAVFTVEGRRIVQRPVRIGARNAEFAVVIEGLRVDDLVVIYPSDSLRDHQRVQRTETPAREARRD